MLTSSPMYTALRTDSMYTFHTALPSPFTTLEPRTWSHRFSQRLACKKSAGVWALCIRDHWLDTNRWNDATVILGSLHAGHCLRSLLFQSDHWLSRLSTVRINGCASPREVPQVFSGSGIKLREKVNETPGAVSKSSNS